MVLDKYPDLCVRFSKNQKENKMSEDAPTESLEPILRKHLEKSLGLTAVDRNPDTSEAYLEDFSIDNIPKEVDSKDIQVFIQEFYESQGLKYVDHVLCGDVFRQPDGRGIWVNSTYTPPFLDLPRRLMVSVKTSF